MNVISASTITASALDAEKLRLDVISENIANAHTTRAMDGHAYQRKVVSFESALDEAFGSEGEGVRIGSITKDSTPGEQVYDPRHPHADARGMVQMPNVNVAHEMIDLITASRAYEANLAVVRNARQMAAQALGIGRP
jgi:flagellar basal-body rod protein FlgC